MGIVIRGLGRRIREGREACWKGSGYVGLMCFGEAPDSTFPWPASSSIDMAAKCKMWWRSMVWEQRKTRLLPHHSSK